MAKSKQPFKWHTEHQKTFKQVKKILSTAPCLAFQYLLESLYWIVMSPIVRLELNKFKFRMEKNEQYHMQVCLFCHDKEDTSLPKNNF